MVKAVNPDEILHIAAHSPYEVEDDAIYEYCNLPYSLEIQTVTSTETSQTELLPISLTCQPPEDIPQDLSSEDVIPGTIPITLHRGQVFEELIETFQILDKNCETIRVTMKSTNGKEEAGVDAGGVFRDALSEFFSTFYEKCTTGTSQKIPYLRHDFKDKWKVIARIIFKGWHQVKYFPLEISEIFMRYSISGHHKMDDDVLLDSFYKFISFDEAEFLKKAIEDFDSVNGDELIDTLDNLHCKIKVDKHNIRKVLVDIAHKELIQEPMFVIDAWYSEINNMMSAEELDNIYVNLKVNSKNILPLLTFGELAEAAQKVQGYLKKFIREADELTLKRFLRFCTGADMIVTKRISVNFNELQGIARQPKANTCVFSIDLSSTFENYPEFKSEMNAILSSNYWVMDNA